MASPKAGQPLHGATCVGRKAKIIPDKKAQPQFETEKKKGSRAGLARNPIGRDKSQGSSSECNVDGVERKKTEAERRTEGGGVLLCSEPRRGEVTRRRNGALNRKRQN